MQQLGATPLLTAPGLGDDQEQLGYDAALEPWSEALWTRLLASDALPLPAGVVPKRDGLMPPRFRVEMIDQPPPAADAMRVDDVELKDSAVYSSKHPYLAEISSINRVTPVDHFQDVRLVQIELGNSGITHPPGAVLSIMPRNLETDATAFCEMAGLDPGQWIRLVRLLQVCLHV
jgi:sulfite reductase alpha subunit-like flavoprotein